MERKDKSTAGILALFLGGLGFHKFYLGKPLQGLFYLVFCWTFIPVFIAFLESLTYFFNSQQWFDERYNQSLITPNIVGSNTSAVLELEKLGELLDKGFITQAEFSEKKEILLKKIS